MPPEAIDPELDEIESIAPATVEVDDTAKEEPNEDATPSLSDALNSEMDKSEAESERTRDENGRFAAKASDDDANPENSGDEPGKEEEEKPETPAIPAPQSLTADQKENWSKLTPEWQEAIATREQQAHQYISKVGEQLAQHQPIADVANRHAARITQTGLSPEEYFEDLARSDLLRASNPQAAILELAENTGVDILDLALTLGEGMQPAPQQTRETLDQQLDIQQQQQQLQQEREQLATQQQQQEAAALDQMLDAFSADKPDLETVLDDMLPIMVGLQHMNPTIEKSELINTAYQQARLVNKDTRAAVVADEVKTQKAERAAKLNVKTVQAQPTPPSSMTDFLDQELTRFRAGNT